MRAGPIMIAANPGNWLFVWIVHCPVPRLYSTSAVTLDRRRVEAVEVELVDPHDVVGLLERGAEVTPLVDAGPGEIRADLLVQHRCLVVQRDPRVDDDGERVVVDLDHVGGVSRELPRRCGHGDHGLARVANLADREREIAHVRPGGVVIWKNGSVKMATSSPVSVPNTPGSSSAAETSIERIFACAYGERTKCT